MPLPNTQGPRSRTQITTTPRVAACSISTRSTAASITTSHSISECSSAYSKRNQDNVPAVLWPKEIALAEDRINERNRMYNGVAGLHRTRRMPQQSIRGRIAYARSLYFYENQGLDFKASSLGLPVRSGYGRRIDHVPAFTRGYASLGNADNRYNAFMTYTAGGSVTASMGAYLEAGYEGRMIRVTTANPAQRQASSRSAPVSRKARTLHRQGLNRGNSIASLLLGTGAGVIQSFKDASAQSFYSAAVFAGRLARDQQTDPEPWRPLRSRYTPHRTVRSDELLRSERRNRPSPARCPDFPICTADWCSSASTANLVRSTFGTRIISRPASASPIS